VAALGVTDSVEDGYIGASFAGVRELRFRSPSSAENDIVGAAADTLTGLTTLSLGGYRGRCGMVMPPTTYAGITRLAPLASTLTSLDLAFSDVVTDRGAEALAGLTALASLDLTACMVIKPQGVAVLAAALAATLTSLDLSYTEADHAMVRELAPLAGSLRRLMLAGCQEVTDEAVRALAPLTSLTHLDLSDCRRVTDDGVQAVASSLASLECLYLCRNKHLTAPSAWALTGLRRLKTLDLSDCKGVETCDVYPGKSPLAQ
jgi:hypothetical protein